MVKTSKKVKKVKTTKIKDGDKKTEIVETTKTVETTVDDTKAAKLAKQAKLNKAKAKAEESVDVKKTQKKESRTSKRFRQIEKITGQHKLERGILYLGHIPFGFFETEIKDFFAQFGKITRVKLARSKKTARSKGYAFIEFADLKAAAIAADTMNDRFMMDRRLVCHVVDDQNVHRVSLSNIICF